MTDRPAATLAAEIDGSREPLSRRMWVGLIMLTLSTFIVVLDTSVVFIALPAILQDLGGSLDLATWILAGFILAFAVFLLPFGKIGDIYGRRRLCLAGITVFTAASVACALAPTIEVLVAARVMQGVGAAMVEPTVLALIKGSFPRGRLGLAFGVQGVSAGVAASLGPTLGGAITTAYSWEFIFLINVPVGLVAFVGIALTVAESRREPDVSRRVDLPGMLLSAIGLFALVFGIIEGSELGWQSPVILGSFAIAAVFLVLFVIVEARTVEPLVDLRLFRDRMFSVGNVLRGAVEFATLGVFFPLVLFLQVQLGYTALETGLVLLPLIVGSFFTSPLAGSLSDRVDVRFIVVPGLLTATAGIFWLAHLRPDSDWITLLPPLAVLGLGLGSLYGTTTSATLRNVSNAQSGVASSISYAAFLLGAEMGVATVGAVLQNQLVANLRQSSAVANLPPEILDGIGSSIGAGPGASAAQQNYFGASPELQEVFDIAFADAVNAALFVCVVATAAAAVLAMFLSSGTRARHRYKRPPTGIKVTVQLSAQHIPARERLSLGVRSSPGSASDADGSARRSGAHRLRPLLNSQALRPLPAT